MKNLRYCLLLAISSLLVASCGYPDHLQTLPKETVAVVSFDLAGMASKGDLDKLQEAEFYKKMQEKIGEKDAEAAKETDEFLKNPLNYGINFLEPVYFFVINNGSETKPTAGFSIALGDAEKFKTFITKSAKIEEKGLKIEANTGYSVLKTGDIDFAWNDFALIVLPNLDKDAINGGMLDKIFASKSDDQSVVDVPGFEDYYDNSKDISGWVSMNVLNTFMDMAKAFGGSSQTDELADYKEQMEKFKDASFEFHVTFNDDEVYTEYTTQLPDEIKDMYDEEIFRSGCPEKVSNLIREKDLGVIALSLNIQNYLKMMAENPAFAGEDKEEMANYIKMAQQFIAPFDGDLLITISDVKVFERTVTEQIPVVEAEDTTISDLTASVDGEIVEAEEDYSDWDWDVEYKDTTYIKKETLPIFLAATTVNDETFGFLGMMLGKDKPTAGKVTTTELGEFKLYSTIKDKVVVVSNDKKTIEDVNAGSFKGDNGCLAAKGASDHGVYVYANLDLAEYPKVVQDLINEQKPNKEEAAILKLITMFDHFESYTKEDYTAVVSVKLKPNGHNSLYTILEHAGNAAYEAGAFN